MINAQEACTVYTVKPGDSLSGIARTAYGNISFQTIWDANRTTIGRNPNAISVGSELRLPCADGSLPGDVTASAAETVVAESEVANTETPDTGPLEISLVTASGYAPFTDEDMEGGGIYTQLVREAMATVEQKATTSITFVNDWGSHFETLLPAGAFAGSFPWVRPNCEEPGTLTENSIMRCNNFLHSDPFYEIIDSLTVNADSPLATTEDHADFHGTTICLPDGYTDAVLASYGLVEPVVSFSRPVDPDDCIRQLDAGDVQAVSMEQRQVEDIIRRLDLEGDFAINPNLNSITTLTVYVAKENPNAAEIVEVLNEGLTNIRENGTWFGTIRTGFQDFYQE